MADKKKKIALVLSGGGFLGAFQYGALQHLIEQRGMKFDLIAGVSVGALNGSLVASDKFKDLENLWNSVKKNGVTEIYTSEFIDTSVRDQIKLNTKSLKKYLPTFWQKIRMISKKYLHTYVSHIIAELHNTKSVADNQPLFEKIKKSITKAGIKTRFSCGFVSLDTGEYYAVDSQEFNTDTDLQAGILASTSIPIVWPPYPEIATSRGTLKNLTDGGGRNISPLGDVIDIINNDAESEYLIVIINCHAQSIPQGDYSDSNLLQLALRTTDGINLSEILKGNIAPFIRTNDMLKALNIPFLTYYDSYSQKEKTVRAFSSIVIEPDIDLGNNLLASTELISTRIEHGNFIANREMSKFASMASNNGHVF